MQCTCNWKNYFPLDLQAVNFISVTYVTYVINDCVPSGLSLLNILKSNLIIETDCLHCKLRKDTFIFSCARCV